MYPHLDRVFLTVVNKRNSIVGLLNAIDGHTRLATAGGRLPDSDVKDSFPVSVMLCPSAAVSAPASAAGLDFTGSDFVFAQNF